MYPNPKLQHDKNCAIPSEVFDSPEILHPLLLFWSHLAHYLIQQILLIWSSSNIAFFISSSLKPLMDLLASSIVLKANTKSLPKTIGLCTTHWISRTKPKLLVSLPLLWQNTWEKQFKGEKIHFGSWFQRGQSMIACLSLWSHDQSEHRGGRA